MLEVIDFGIIDVLDIVAVALILFYLYRVLRRSRSLYVFVGIVIFVLLYLVTSEVLQMRLLGKTMSSLTNVGVISLIVIFQEEIRKFFYNLGTNKSVRRFITFFHSDQESNSKVSRDEYIYIVRACLNMSKQKTGALIVIEKGQKLDDIVQLGDILDAKIKQRHRENIFFKNSPLHDGALLISNGRIKAASCILPVSHDYDIPKELGLRHRSAMGVSQVSDAIAIVVSEETGRIAVAESGTFHLRLTSEQLEEMISKKTNKPKTINNKQQQ